MNFVILSQQKPREGQPCNGCGHCCQAVACRISTEFLGSYAAPCIALEWDGVSRYRCGMITRPTHYLAVTEPLDDQEMIRQADEIIGELIGKILHAGEYCDSMDFSAEL